MVYEKGDMLEGIPFENKIATYITIIDLENEFSHTGLSFLIQNRMLLKRLSASSDKISVKLNKYFTSFFSFC